MYIQFLKCMEFFANCNTSSNTSELLLESLPLQQIYYGAPGTGKSHTVNKITQGYTTIRTTFHPDSDYSTFVGCYKPTTKTIALRDLSGHKIVEDGEAITEDRIVYEFVPQAFVQAYVEAWKDTEKPVFLVIEEINRGNCAQIFGDLFQLLDRKEDGFSSYPIKPDQDLAKYIAKELSGEEIDNEDVKSGNILLLPNNLYIWATMNTSDQSLFPIDSAFKRRWDWKYVPISQGRNEDGGFISWSICANTKKYDWWSFLQKINEKVGSTTNSEDKKLGFFFCKAKDGEISAETFVGKVIFYLWNDVFKDYGFDDEIFKDGEGKLTFDKFYGTDDAGNTVVNKEKVEIFLKNLGVKVEYEEDTVVLDEDGNDQTSQTSSQRDVSLYTINGNGSYKKGRVLFEAIKVYTSNNPNLSAEEVVNNWLGLGVNMPNLAETKERYKARTANSKDSHLADKVKVLQLPNGEEIYVSNQFNPDRIVELVNKVNAQDWGITIAKIF